MVMNASIAEYIHPAKKNLPASTLNLKNNVFPVTSRVYTHVTCRTRNRKTTLLGLTTASI